MLELVQTAVALARAQWHTARRDDGATAIEWAIFALLALSVGGIVAGAITLAVNNRAPKIK
jgi:Flp pilus assembly protein TadG